MDSVKKRWGKKREQGGLRNTIKFIKLSLSPSLMDLPYSLPPSLPLCHGSLLVSPSLQLRFSLGNPNSQFKWRALCDKIWPEVGADAEFQHGRELKKMVNMKDIISFCQYILQNTTRKTIFDISIYLYNYKSIVIYNGR